MTQTKLSPKLVALLTGLKNRYSVESQQQLTNKQRTDLCLVELYGPVEERTYVDTLTILTWAWFEACQIKELCIHYGGQADTLTQLLLSVGSLSSGLRGRKDLEITDFYEALIGRMNSDLLMTRIDWCRDQLPDLKS